MFPADPSFTLVTQNRNLSALDAAALSSQPLISASVLLRAGTWGSWTSWQSSAASAAQARLFAVRDAAKLIGESASEQQTILRNLVANLRALEQEQKASIASFQNTFNTIRANHSNYSTAAQTATNTATAAHRLQDQPHKVETAQADSRRFAQMVGGEASAATGLIQAKRAEMGGFEERAQALVSTAVSQLSAIITPQGFDTGTGAFTARTGKLSTSAILGILTNPAPTTAPTRQDLQLATTLLMYDPEAAGVLASLPGFTDLVYGLVPKVAQWDRVIVPGPGDIELRLDERFESVGRGFAAAVAAAALTSQNSFDLSAQDAQRSQELRSMQREDAARQGLSEADHLFNLQESKTRQQQARAGATLGAEVLISAALIVTGVGAGAVALRHAATRGAVAGVQAATVARAASAGARATQAVGAAARSTQAVSATHGPRITQATVKGLGVLTMLGGPAGAIFYGEQIGDVVTTAGSRAVQQTLGRVITTSVTDANDANDELSRIADDASSVGGK